MLVLLIISILLNSDLGRVANTQRLSSEMVYSPFCYSIVYVINFPLSKCAANGAFTEMLAKALFFEERFNAGD